MNDPAPVDGELQRFLDGTLDPSGFNHAAHIRVAEGLLAGHEFLEAAWLYDRGIRAVAAKAGAPGKRSVTKTLAFLALIAGGERPGPAALARWYSDERLASETSHARFVMPDRYQP